MTLNTEVRVAPSAGLQDNEVRAAFEEALRLHLRQVARAAIRIEPELAGQVVFRCVATVAVPWWGELTAQAVAPESRVALRRALVRLVELVEAFVADSVAA